MMKKFILTTSVCLALTACSQPPATFHSYGVEKGAGSVGVHRVLEGDTVYSISKNYQLPMREIITMNNIQPPYHLNTGYRLKLPPPNEYQVRNGDTVESIARLYEVSPNRLVTLNNLQGPFKLTQGQVVRLPSKLEGVNPNFNAPPPRRVISLPNNPIANSTPSSVASAPRVRLEPVTSAPLNPPLSAASVPEGKTASLTLDKSPIKPPVAQQVKQAAKQTVIPKSVGKFMRPIDGKVISTYGPKKNGLHNDGVNIKAVKGTPVRAAQNGVVVYNGDDLEGYGNLILIRHENKLMTAYAHLDKTLIERGSKVVRGQSIGTVGKTGQVDTPQLHFEIRKGSTPLNPDKYL